MKHEQETRGKKMTEDLRIALIAELKARELEEEALRLRVAAFMRSHIVMSKRD